MIRNEKLLSMAAAVEAVTGQRPSPSTLHRWRLNGIAGVKLESVRCGGRRLSSIEAVRRFLEEVTAAADGEPPPKPRTIRQREGDIKRAEQCLEEEGI